MSEEYIPHNVIIIINLSNCVCHNWMTNGTRGNIQLSSWKIKLKNDYLFSTYTSQFQHFPNIFDFEIFIFLSFSLYVKRWSHKSNISKFFSLFSSDDSEINFICDTSLTAGKFDILLLSFSCLFSQRLQTLDENFFFIPTNVIQINIKFLFDVNKLKTTFLFVFFCYYQNWFQKINRVH